MRPILLVAICSIVTLVLIGLIWRNSITRQTAALERQHLESSTASARNVSDRLVASVRSGPSQQKQHNAQPNSNSRSKTSSSFANITSGPKSTRSPPDQVDWRQVANRVGPVREQGDCGAGWAFAAAGVLEGQQVVVGTSEKLVPLSVQNLIDCSTSNQACDSGWVDQALEDMAHWGGLESEQDYRYEFNMHKYPCRFNKSKSVMSAAGAISFVSRGEDHLKRLVADFGPVAIGVCSANWHNYSTGVFDHIGCGSILNHAALVVGYGTEPNGDGGGGDFWIIKNSWGVDWGERGYIRVRRGKNRCGLGLYSIIPKWSPK